MIKICADERAAVRAENRVSVRVVWPPDLRQFFGGRPVADLALSTEVAFAGENLVLLVVRIVVLKSQMRSLRALKSRARAHAVEERHQLEVGHHDGDAKAGELRNVDAQLRVSCREHRIVVAVEHKLAEFERSEGARTPIFLTKDCGHSGVLFFSTCYWKSCFGSDLFNKEKFWKVLFGF